MPAQISNPMWRWHVDCCFRKYQRHKSPTINADLALKDPTRSLKQGYMWRFRGCVLKPASFHKTWRMRPEVRVPAQTYRVPFVYIEEARAASLPKSWESRLSQLSQTIQSCVLSNGQSRVYLDEPELRFHQQFRAASSLQARAASQLQT